MYELLSHPSSTTNFLNGSGSSYIMGFLFTNRKSSKVSTVKRAPHRLRIIFSSSPLSWCLSSDLRSGVFSVQEIYVEIYVYVDVFERVLMTSYFVFLTISSGNHILRTHCLYISFPHNFTKKYLKKLQLYMFRIQPDEIFP